MMKILLILLSFLSSLQATTYYLSPTGSDGNAGTSAGAPWLSPNHALNCGDEIIAAAGAYSASNFASGDWGTVTCATGDNVAVLRCETPFACTISASNVFAMHLSKSFWGVYGWKVTASGNNGVCFGIIPVGGATIHHIVFANNIADTCANGFAVSNQSTTASVDYVAFVGNSARNATLSTVLCNSGFTVYEPIKYDSLPGTHIYLAGNFAFKNATLTNCLGGSATYDGNGIALDDIGGTQGGVTPYDQQIVAENNLSVFNGGWGLATSGNGSPSAPIYFRGNTSVKNLAASNTSMTTCGDMVLLVTSLARVFQNLVLTSGATACSGAVALYAVAVNEVNGTDKVYSNWLYSAAGNNINAISSAGFSSGPNNTTGTDPQLLNPVDPGIPDCTGHATTVACMDTVIANFTPQLAAARAYGYQRPTAVTTGYDPLFPRWLCNVNLPAGLITTPCGLPSSYRSGSSIQ